MHIRTFLNGIVVGIILGVMFAPDSGEETRRKISRRAAGIKDQYEEITDNVTDIYDKAKSKAKSLVGKAKDDFDEVRDESDSMYTN